MNMDINFRKKKVLSKKTVMLIKDVKNKILQKFL